MNIRLAKRDLKTKFGTFLEILIYAGQRESLVLVTGNVENGSYVICRVHSACVSGTMFLAASNSNVSTKWKGSIAVGSDGKIVIFDTEKEHTFTLDAQHMNVDYCAYEGKTIKGKVETVRSRGRIVNENDECLVEKGDGQFIRRGTCVNI